MNTTLNKANTPNDESNFENNFNTVVKVCDANYSYEELIAFLASDKVIEKQLAALELEEIKTQDDAFTLVSNLVGQDGKIREAVANKINELAKEKYSEFFIDEKFFKIFLEGIMDINGNVCRQIVELTALKEFSDYLCNNLPQRVNEILKEIKKLDENSKQYKISKRNFQLYWCLEALYSIANDIKIEQLKPILETTGEFYDYTIREKTAKILTRIDNPEFKELKEKLNSDENYYVRRYL